MKFEFPQLTLLTSPIRTESYGPENPYHCTFQACCFMGK